MLQEYVKDPKKLSQDVKDMVLNGEVNPIMVKIMHDIFNDAMKDQKVKEAIMAEADLHGPEIEVSGFRYKKSSRRTYDYKHDHEWTLLKAKISAREEKMKLAMESEIADGNTGEIIPPATVKSSEFLRKC